jgi:hypothetical protein
VALLCQPAVHTPFTQGFPQLSGAKCSRCIPRSGSTRGQIPPQKEPLECRQQHATFDPGRKPKNQRNCGHAPSRKSENLSKDQFGVLAKGTLRKLYSRIEAPWPELIEGIRPLIHQMLNERRELHKNAQQATHLLSIHCLYQTPAVSARGFVKKVDGGGSGAIFGGSKCRTRIFAGRGALWGSVQHVGPKRGNSAGSRHKRLVNSG